MSEHDFVDQDFPSQGYTLFETAIGRCGIVWSERGIVGVQFPEGSEQATRNRLERRFPNAREAVTPQTVQHTIGDITALLRGEPRDLNDAVLDSTGVPDFNRRVYEVARAIPPGGTLSYGEVAERLGDRNLARDVAQALGPKPVSNHCALPSGDGRRRQDRRIFRARRRAHEVEAVIHRTRAARRPDIV